MTALLELISIAWCRAHHRIGAPTGAYYTCMDCCRQYAVPWAKADEVPEGCHVNE